MTPSSFPKTWSLQEFPGFKGRRRRRLSAVSDDIRRRSCERGRWSGPGCIRAALRSSHRSHAVATAGRRNSSVHADVRRDSRAPRVSISAGARYAWVGLAIQPFGDVGPDVDRDATDLLDRCRKVVEAGGPFVDDLRAVGPAALRDVRGAHKIIDINFASHRRKRTGRARSGRSGICAGGGWSVVRTEPDTDRIPENF